MGLGKTLVAEVVLCQLWAERRRRLLVICPASLRKQWAQELADKFNLPTDVLDALPDFSKLDRSAFRIELDTLLALVRLVGTRCLYLRRSWP